MESQLSRPLQPRSDGMPVYHLSTTDAYNAWASVYDTDGNMLQAIDDDELSRQLPNFLNQIILQAQNQRIRVLDVGCGTGRNTAKLLSFEWPQGSTVEIVGLDASSEMLKKAHEKLHTIVSTDPQVSKARPSLELLEHDFLTTKSLPAGLEQQADGVISTLVLEHLPLDVFFSNIASLLRPGGLALVTNMHSDMGKVSQAGFIADASVLVGANLATTLPRGQVKIRGTSWVYGVEESVDAAERVGLELLGDASVRDVTEDMVGTIVGQRGRKWVGYKVWYGMTFRKRE